MGRPLSLIAPEWWDYTTLDRELLEEVAHLTPKDIEGMSRDGFRIVMYDDLREFFLAEAFEYIEAWRQATPDRPVGVCGPIGPTEQLPLVAQLVNAMELDLTHAHFWGMDEWYIDGKEAPENYPLSFARADRELCFDRIHPDLRMPEKNIHFPRLTPAHMFKVGIRPIVRSCKAAKARSSTGPSMIPRREGNHVDEPPLPDEYLKLGTRVVDLHPLTLVQNARTSGGGNIPAVTKQAITVGPIETWKAERVSIWHPGWHDNPFGLRLTTYMISKGVADASVPMSLLARHPNVQFNFYRPGISTCEVEMH